MEPNERRLRSLPAGAAMLVSIAIRRSDIGLPSSDDLPVTVACNATKYNTIEPITISVTRNTILARKISGFGTLSIGFGWIEHHHAIQNHSTVFQSLQCPSRHE
jgi:hypothetical protein